jgi:HD-like signal output (HDOD) protein
VASKRSLSPGKESILGKTKSSHVRVVSHAEGVGIEGAYALFLALHLLLLRSRIKLRLSSRIYFSSLFMNHRNCVLDSIRGLPPLPASTGTLLKLLQAAKMDTDRICKAITLDPCLSELVSGIANSQLLADRAEVGSIRGAVSRLGHKLLIASLLGSAVRPMLQQFGMTFYDTSQGGLYEQSVALALASEQVAIQSAILNPADAFTVGLLADVGKLGMASTAAEHGHELVEVTMRKGLASDSAEREILNIDHPEASALMLKSWGLPRSIVVPVQWHHRPDQCPLEYQALADTAHVAHYLCEQMGGPLSFNASHLELHQSCMDRLHITEDDMELAIYSVENKIDNVMRAFGIQRKVG